MDKPRDTFILLRGDYRNHGEKVEPEYSRCSAAAAERRAAQSADAREMAGRSGNPLTARVAVNHFWQMYFRSRHRENQRRFRLTRRSAQQSGSARLAGDRVHRTQMGCESNAAADRYSAAYRQASKVTPELLEKDPENRLLARGPRFRLPAEMVRDNALVSAA